MTTLRFASLKTVGAAAVALLFVGVGLGTAGTEEPDAETVVTAWERFVDEATANPGDCAALRTHAAAFLAENETALRGLEEPNAVISSGHSARLESSQERLVPMLLLCGGGALGGVEADSSEDSCKRAKTQCPKICPVGKWSCVVQTGACAGGDHRACCWTAMCLNSKKGCILTCKDSCICDVPQ